MMMASCTMARHFGEWLKREISLLGVPQTEFARSSGIPRSTLQMWFKEPKPEILPYRLPGLARSLGRSVDDLERELEEAEAASPGEPPETVYIDVLNRPGMQIRLPRRGPIVGGISAGALDERPGMEPGFIEYDPPTQFFLQVEGDCMEPDYHDGELVLFSAKLVEEQGILDGEDYGISLRGDDKTTFKRVYADPRDSEKLLLRCANRTGKFKSWQMKLRRDEIGRIGKAVWIMRRPRRKGL